MNTAPAISVIVPTLNGAGTLPALLTAVARAGRRHALEIVAIDSGSTDGTVELLRAAGARVLDLGGVPFGHASARNRAAAHARGSILVWLTQDVEPVGEEWLDALVAPLAEPGTVAAFGRQHPRGASPEEAYLASVNYGDASRRIAPADAAAFGPGRLLFSSAFAAMRRDVWQRLPFPGIVMSEDQAWALAALRTGHEIVYVPSAVAHHGHWFSLGRVFRRSFDSGSSLGRLGLAGSAWGSGMRHLVREIRWIAARHGAASAVHAVTYEIVRMAGFQCGRLEHRLPAWVGRLLGEAPREPSTVGAPRLLPAD